MGSFEDARDALVRTIRSVFPNAKPVEPWAGVEAWGVPRPKEIVQERTPGTYDPKLTVIGIADRKSGPVIYFLDPGDYYALDTHKRLLTEAGFKLGRGCIMHTRKGPLPTEPLAELFRLVKDRDAAAAANARTTKPAGTKSAPASDAKGKAAVDAYIAAIENDAHRKALERLRRQVKAAAPDATEKISYGMPTFAHRGKNLVHMAAFPKHCSFFVGRKLAAKELASDLSEFDVLNSTIRFTPAKPLPAALVQRIVKMRIAENEAAAAKKSAAKKAAAKTNKAARAKPTGRK